MDFSQLASHRRGLESSKKTTQRVAHAARREFTHLYSPRSIADVTGTTIGVMTKKGQHTGFWTVYECNIFQKYWKTQKGVHWSSLKLAALRLFIISMAPKESGNREVWLIGSFDRESIKDMVCFNLRFYHLDLLVTLYVARFRLKCNTWHSPKNHER